ncbi:MAG: TetR/AcrR family transcriptional regulator [Bacteroidetes bacterium]|nr:TetR/AcrR family transcriptional regulator [Bacteroidota bacterium]MBU1719629.1 TetR/AcrR family transcriptional regulator [Bacteroidota bacterium]
MSPRTPEQFESIRKRKREAILDAGLNVFANKGFHNASMNEVAQLAGISKGLIYNYFKSKEDLLQEIMLDGVNTLVPFFDPNKDGVLTREEFIFFVSESLDAVKKNREFWALYFALSLQPGIAKLIMEQMLKYLMPLMLMLVEYYKNKGEKDPEGLAMTAGAFLDGITMNYAANPEMFPIEAAKKIFIEKFV